MNSVYTDAAAFLSDNEKLGTGLPYSDDVSVLREPISLGGKTVPNRIVYQAMEGCDGEPCGVPSELTMRRYGRFARGGAGLIWFEATAVLPEGRANPRQLMINEKNLDGFKRALESVKSEAVRAGNTEPTVIIQLTHSGRYSKPNGRPEPLIAYNSPLLEGDSPIDPSRIVDDEYIDRIGEALAYSAVLAERAGFDGADIKCCHRYLDSELLSAYDRKGKYGGSFENRTRLLRESAANAISLCGKDFIVTSRLNIHDGFPYPYGFGVSRDGDAPDMSEPIRLVSELKEIGMKLIDLTMGNPYFNPHVNRPFAKGPYEPPEHPLTGAARMICCTAEIKAAVGDIAVIGSAYTFLGAAAAGVAAGAVKSGGADLAGFGRMAFAYPDFAGDALCGRTDVKKLCIACSKCTELMRAGSTPGCVIRDKYYTDLYKKVIIDGRK